MANRDRLDGLLQSVEAHGETVQAITDEFSEAGTAVRVFTASVEAIQQTEEGPSFPWDLTDAADRALGFADALDAVLAVHRKLTEPRDLSEQREVID